MFRRTFAALLMVGSVAVPARAEAGRVVVLRGSRSASVVVTFPRRFRPEVGIDGPARMAVRTTGHYAGVWFESVADPERLAVGGVVVPAMAGAAGALPVGWGSSDSDTFSLPAGRYRVHLLTDGTSEVRIGVSGLARDVTLAPSAPTTAVGRLVRLAAGPVAAGGAATIAVAIRPATTTILAASADADASTRDAVRICLGRSGGTAVCDAKPDAAMYSSGGGIGSRSSTQDAMFVYPGWLPNGEYAAEYTVATAGVPHGGTWAFALSLR